MKSFNNCKNLTGLFIITDIVPCAIDVASAVKHKEIIRILLEANQKIKQHYLDLHKEVRYSINFYNTGNI